MRGKTQTARYNRSKNEERAPFFKLVSQANLQQRMNSVALFASEKWLTLT